ncbi:hypothetical protein BC829DRAFT_422654 [Chytridium lagenaria]|nr:hypothetical protein BC829DRAFT_422654 [Chytridium lagenaria]
MNDGFTDKGHIQYTRTDAEGEESVADDGASKHHTGGVFWGGVSSSYLLAAAAKLIGPGVGRVYGEEQVGFECGKFSSRDGFEDLAIFFLHVGWDGCLDGNNAGVGEGSESVVVTESFDFIQEAVKTMLMRETCSRRWDWSMWEDGVAVDKDEEVTVFLDEEDIVCNVSRVLGVGDGCEVRDWVWEVSEEGRSECWWSVLGRVEGIGVEGVRVGGVIGEGLWDVGMIVAGDGEKWERMDGMVLDERGAMDVNESSRVAARGSGKATVTADGEAAGSCCRWATRRTFIGPLYSRLMTNRADQPILVQMLPAFSLKKLETLGSV